MEVFEFIIGFLAISGLIGIFGSLFVSGWAISKIDDIGNNKK